MAGCCDTCSLPSPDGSDIFSLQYSNRDLGLWGPVPDYGEEQPVGTVCAPVIHPRLSSLSKCPCFSCLYPTFSTTCSSYSYPSCLHSSSCFTFLSPLLRASPEFLLCIFLQLPLTLFSVLWIWLCCFFPSPFMYQVHLREQTRLLAALRGCALQHRGQIMKSFSAFVSGIPSRC